MSLESGPICIKQAGATKPGNTMLVRTTMDFHMTLALGRHCGEDCRISAPRLCFLQPDASEMQNPRVQRATWARTIILAKVRILWRTIAQKSGYCETMCVCVYVCVSSPPPLSLSPARALARASSHSICLSVCAPLPKGLGHTDQDTQVCARAHTHKHTHAHTPPHTRCVSTQLHNKIVSSTSDVL